MKKVLFLCIMGMILLSFTQSVGAYPVTLKNDLITIKVDQFGKVTALVPGGGDLNLLREQSHFVRFGNRVYSLSEFTYRSWETRREEEENYLATTVGRTEIDGEVIRELIIMIETKLVPGKLYFDQRVNMLYQCNRPIRLEGVRHFVLTSGSDAYAGGYVYGTQENAATSIWQCMRDTVSSWRTQPTRSTIGEDWVRTTPPREPFLSIGDGVRSCGWVIGGRGQSSVGDDFAVGEYGNVLNQIMQGQLTPPPLPVTTTYFKMGPYTAPTFARQWDYGTLFPYPTEPYAYLTDVRTEAVPEPATLLLLGIGTGLLGLSRGMRRRK